MLVLSETEDRTHELLRYISERLVLHRAALRVAADMCALLGWDAVMTRLTPSQLSVRHGDFGEMLAEEILVEFAGLEVPVRKVRHQMHADQTLIGADVVALELKDGSVLCVHFAEAKFRSTSDTSAADSAHQQLRRWYTDEFGQILFFVGSRLEEANPDLYDAFLRYLSDSDDRQDHFHIVLIWDNAVWSDTVLTNIPATPERLEPLTVRVVLIDGLAAVTEQAYERMEAVVRRDT